MKRIMHLSEKIYLLTYAKPRFKTEISNMLYGKESKQIYPEIDKLVKKHWIKKVEMKRKMEDYRERRREYYYADTYPLFSSIINDLKKEDVVLKPFEITVLMHLLDSEIFRRYIDGIIKEAGMPKEESGLSIVKRNFFYLCIFTSWVKRYGSDRLEIKKGSFLEKLTKQRFSNCNSIWDLVGNLDSQLLDKLLALDYYMADVMYKSFNMLANTVEEKI